MLRLPTVKQIEQHSKVGTEVARELQGFYGEIFARIVRDVGLHQTKKAAIHEFIAGTLEIGELAFHQPVHYWASLFRKENKLSAQKRKKKQLRRSRKDQKSEVKRIRRDCL